MGYTTEFKGSLTFNKSLSDKMLKYVQLFNNTRRMGRNIEGFGAEGEFYAFSTENMGQNYDENIIDYNGSPKTQPGLWCQWTSYDGLTLEWDGSEKFYNYTEWLYYLINKVFAPNGYVLNGTITYRGEDFGDFGEIYVQDNKVYLNGDIFTNSDIGNEVFLIDNLNVKLLG